MGVGVNAERDILVQGSVEITGESVQDALLGSHETHDSVSIIRFLLPCKEGEKKSKIEETNKKVKILDKLRARGD